MLFRFNSLTLLANIFSLQFTEISENQPSSSWASKSRFFPYIHCKFCRVCPTTKITSTTMKPSIPTKGSLLSSSGPNFFFRCCHWTVKRPLHHFLSFLSWRNLRNENLSQRAQKGSDIHWISSKRERCGGHFHLSLKCVMRRLGSSLFSWMWLGREAVHFHSGKRLPDLRFFPSAC